MSANLRGILISFLFIFALIALSTLLERWRLLSKEGTRKLIHIGVANWWLIAMRYFTDPAVAAVVPAAFVVLNYASYRFNLFTAMERGQGKGDLGTVYYPISLLILALCSFGRLGAHVGGLGILIMGYGDGFAALVGQRFGRHRYRVFGNTRSLEGSLAMFLVSWLVGRLFLAAFAPAAAPLALLLAAIATLLEAVTPLGLDNLTVPLGVTFAYWLLSGAALPVAAGLATSAFLWSRARLGLLWFCV